MGTYSSQALGDSAAVGPAGTWIVPLAPAGDTLAFRVEAARLADRANLWPATFGPTTAAIAESAARGVRVPAPFVVTSTDVVEIVAVVVVESALAIVALPSESQTVESV